MLVGFKSVIGLISGSIAIVLDAVNNLSDVLSSVITIVGTKLAGRAPDRKHPYGHGRIEYIASLAIAIIVLFAGITSMIESVKKIIEPTDATYSVVMLIIVIAAIAVKFSMGMYIRGVGKSIHSNALFASGTDALFDAVLSIGTLLAAVISLIWHLSLEGYFGAIISIFILKAGFEILRENVSTIVGTRADEETTENLRKMIESFPQVHGAYDIALHNYGPSNLIGSAHIEVDEDMTARDIHKLTRMITATVYEKLGIVLTLGIYSSAQSADPLVRKVQAALEEEISSEPMILQVHGVFVDPEAKTVTFDIVVDFKGNGQEIRTALIGRMQKRFPDLSFYAVIDSDYSTSKEEPKKKKER